jgi:hypothetical protein
MSINKVTTTPRFNESTIMRILRKNETSPFSRPEIHDECWKICGRDFYLSYGHPSTDRYKTGHLVSKGSLSTMKHEQLNLKDYQVPHFKRLCDKLERHPVVFDCSKPGRGKTIIGGAIGTYYRMPMLVICPAIAEENVWAKTAIKYGWNIIDVISFDRLRGQLGKDCGHIYFNRDEQGIFTVTEKLRRLMDSGILIVIDEISKLKNQHTGVKRAVHVMITELLSSCKRISQRNEMEGMKLKSSRSVLLSAMPCEKPQHFSSLCQILGLTTSQYIYKHNNDDKAYDLKGYWDVVNWCSDLNEPLTDQILEKYPSINKRTVPNVIMELYDRIIKDELSSCVSAEHIPSTCIKNKFYQLSPDDSMTLINHRRELTRNMEDGGDTHTHIMSMLSNKGSNWSQVSKTLKLLGTSKLRRTFMMATEELESDPHRKVIIGVWYVDHIIWLLEALKAYKSQTIYGSIKAADRKFIIEEFQKPNNRIRVLIINPTVVGMCVPLDDQHGGYPRTLIMFPDYRISEIVQTTGRVSRETTISPLETRIWMVYAAEFKEERRIVSTALAKSINAKRAIGTESGLTLPDSYDVEYIPYEPPNYKLPNLLLMSESIHQAESYDLWT